MLIESNPQNHFLLVSDQILLIQAELVFTCGEKQRESYFVDLNRSTTSITSVGMGFRQDNEEVNKFTVNFRVLQTKIVILRHHLEHQLNGRLNKEIFEKKYIIPLLESISTRLSTSIEKHDITRDIITRSMFQNEMVRNMIPDPLFEMLKSVTPHLPKTWFLH